MLETRDVCTAELEQSVFRAGVLDLTIHNLAIHKLDILVAHSFLL